MISHSVRLYWHSANRDYKLWLPTVTTSCECTLWPYTVTTHCDYTLPLITATNHCDYSLWLLIVTTHCAFTLWLPSVTTCCHYTLWHTLLQIHYHFMKAPLTTHDDTLWQHTIILTLNLYDCYYTFSIATRSLTTRDDTLSLHIMRTINNNT